MQDRKKDESICKKVGDDWWYKKNDGYWYHSTLSPDYTSGIQNSSGNIKPDRVPPTLNDPSQGYWRYNGYTNNNPKWISPHSQKNSSETSSTLHNTKKNHSRERPLN